MGKIGHANVAGRLIGRHVSGLFLTLLAIGIASTSAAINDTLSPALSGLADKSEFTCIDRALGSYYPNYKSKCQKFHLCAAGEDGEVLNLSFLCPEGAAFDDRAADCLPEAIVKCEENLTNDSSSSSSMASRASRKTLKKDLRDDGTGTNYNTSFKCRGKKLGHYYADTETGCRLFHLCTPGSSAKSELYDFQFLCLAGTLFDEEMQRCLEDVKVAGCSATEVASADSSMRLKRDSEEPLSIERLWKVATSPSKRIERQAIGPPSYDMDNLPQTSFSCTGRVPGGYYADMEAGCQMYHVCAVGADNRVSNFRFLCSNGTVFSQQTRTCQTWYTVDCDSTLQFFALNDELPMQQVADVAIGDAVSSMEMPRDNRDFLPSHRTAGTLQEQAQTAHHFSEEQRPISRPTTRSPQFHTTFQDVVQPTVSSAPMNDVAAAPSLSQQRRQQRPRTRGRRKRIRNRQRVQQQREQQQQQRVDPQPPQQAIFHREPEVVSQPDIMVVDQGSLGVRDRIPDLLEELHVRGRFAQDDERRPVSSDDITWRPMSQDPPRRQQQHQSSSRILPTSGHEDTSSSVFQFESPSIVQSPHIESELLREPTRTETRPLRRRPSANVPASRTLTRTEDEVFQPHSDFVSSTVRLPASTPSLRLAPSTTPTTPIPMSPSGVLPALHEIPLFETRGPTVRPASATESTFFSHHYPQPQPQPQPQPAVVRQPTVSQPDMSLDALFLHHLSPALQAQAWSSHNPVGTAQMQQQQQNNDHQLILQQMSTVQQQPSTMSDVFLFLPSSVADFPDPHRFDFRSSRSSRTVPSAIETSTAASQFLEYDSARLTAGGPSSIPPTSFTCKDKVMGGYYADLPTDCQMFHICSTGWQRSVIYDYRFLCGNETLFDQRSLTCTSSDRVDCPTSEAHYPKHPLPEELDADVGHVPDGELLRVRVKRVVPNVRPVLPAELPHTAFSCRGRENGRYYADVETNCELFHLCVEAPGNPGGVLQNHSFLCPNRTVFDQRSQACDDQTDLLNCSEDPPHYGIDEIFGRIPIPVNV